MEIKNHENGEDLVFTFNVNKDALIMLLESTRSYEGKSNKCIITENEREFKSVKQCIPYGCFDKNTYLGIITNFYKTLKRLQEYGMLNEDIKINIDEYGFPDCDLQEYCPFISNMVLLVKDQKEVDCLYYYPILDNYIIDYALSLINDEYRDEFNRILALNFMISTQQRGNMVISALNRLEPKSEKCIYTYIMSDSSGLYKIGKSVSPQIRVNQLKTGNPTIKLEFYISGDHENRLHKLFKNKNLNGEWFKLSNDDLKTIKEIFDSSNAQTLNN